MSYIDPPQPECSSTTNVCLFTAIFTIALRFEVKTGLVLVLLLVLLQLCSSSFTFKFITSSLELVLN